MSNRLTDPKYRKLFLSLNSTFEDLSGNGVTVTPSNVTFAENAFGKTASVFNGTSSYVNAGTGFQDSTFSISFWTKVKDQTTNWESLIGNESYNAGEGWYIVAVNGEFRFHKAGGFGISQAYTYLNQPLFITGTYDGTTMQLYINGVYQASATVAIDNSNSAINLLVGARHQNDGTSISDVADADIWNVSYYNATLTGDEIKTLYNQAIPQNAPVSKPLSVLPDKLDSTLVGSWLNKCTVGTANDYSNSYNDGTPTDVSWGANGEGIFNGTSSGISMGDTLDLGTNDLTAEFVFSSPTFSGDQTIFSKLIGTGTDGFGVFLSNRTPYARIIDGATSIQTALGTNLTLNTKHYGVAIFDRSGSMSLYIDGELYSSIDISSLDGADLQSGEDFCIGKRDNTGSELYFGGAISMLNLYHAAKSSDWVTARYKQLFPESDLVLHTLVSDAQDLSGNENHGAVLGTGVVGNGFEGTGDGVGGTGVLYSAIDSVLTKTEPFTICCSFKPSAANSTDSQTIFAHAVSDSDRIGVTLNTGGTQLQSGIYNGTSYFVKKSTTGGDIKLGQWYRVVVTFDGDSTLTMYLNGEVQTGTTQPALSGDNFMTVGIDTSQSNKEINGKVRDVKIYNTAKDSTFAKQDYEEHKRYF